MKFQITAFLPDGSRLEYKREGGHAAFDLVRSLRRMGYRVPNPALVPAFTWGAP